MSQSQTVRIVAIFSLTIILSALALLPAFAADTGTIVIITEVNPSDDPMQFNYFVAGQGFMQGGGQTTLITTEAGTKYVGQSTIGGYALTGACVDETGAMIGTPFGSDTNDFNVPLSAGATVTCTFSNVNTAGSITIVTERVPDDVTEFTYNTIGLNEAAFMQAGGSSKPFANLNPTNYSIFQAIPNGYILDIDCGDATITPLGNNGVTINLAAQQDVVCTFTNYEVGGTLKIVSNGTPPAGEAFDYFGTLDQFELAGDGVMTTFVDLLPGTYDVLQTIPAGYLTGVSCDGGNPQYAPEGNGATLTMEDNINVTCTFDNTDVGGTITLALETDPAGFEDINHNSNAFADFLLSDGESITFDNIYPGSYGFFQEIPLGGTLSISCDSEAVTVQSDGVIIDLAANDVVACTLSTEGILVDVVPTCDGQDATIYVNALGIIVGGSQDGEIYAGVLIGTDEVDVMVGTDSADIISGGNEQDLICAGDGDDIVEGNNGKDTIYGEAGNDTIHGNNGKDTLFGGDDDDTIIGGKGKDTIDGGAGNNTITQ